MYLPVKIMCLLGNFTSPIKFSFSLNFVYSHGCTIVYFHCSSVKNTEIASQSRKSNNQPTYVFNFALTNIPVQHYSGTLLVRWRAFLRRSTFFERSTCRIGEVRQYMGCVHTAVRGVNLSGVQYNYGRVTITFR